MKNIVVNKYHIKFEIVVEDEKKTLQVTSDVIPYLYGYFIKKDPEHLLEDILPEINNALAGNPFDENGGGVFHFLEIGTIISSFSDDQNNRFNLPTSDVKEIILSYIDWVNDNNLSSYIGNN